uniref:Uncharacterized protein n=1 Tax=uncultured marine group II/III euryarchaeote KM3_83_G03 TaxID=1456522 RepID=A0A075HS71_9EURY|nr:hypothetical protein [uncultured marine group II/III euryarchaeote KM3_83_G03]
MQAPATRPHLGGLGVAVTSALILATPALGQEANLGDSLQVYTDSAGFYAEQATQLYDSANDQFVEMMDRTRAFTHGNRFLPELTRIKQFADVRLPQQDREMEQVRRTQNRGNSAQSKAGYWMMQAVRIKKLLGLRD